MAGYFKDIVRQNDKKMTKAEFNNQISPFNKLPCKTWAIRWIFIQDGFVLNHYLRTSHAWLFKSQASTAWARIISYTLITNYETSPIFISSMQ